MPRRNINAKKSVKLQRYNYKTNTATHDFIILKHTLPKFLPNALIKKAGWFKLNMQHLCIPYFTYIILMPHALVD